LLDELGVPAAQVITEEWLRPNAAQTRQRTHLSENA
jgi:hypothetical protein